VKAKIWFGRCKFEGKKEFYLGNVVAEGELEAERKMKALWSTIVPCDSPKVIVCIPGRIAHIPDEDEV